MNENDKSAVQKLLDRIVEMDFVDWVALVLKVAVMGLLIKAVAFDWWMQ